MKISVNLAALSSARERYALAWAVPLAFLGLAGLIALGWSTVNNYRQYYKIQRTLDTLQRQEQTLKDQESALKLDLDQPQRRDMFHKAHFVNGLIEQKGLSPDVIMEKVAKLLPSSVRLTGVAVAYQKGSVGVRMTVVGKDEDALENFMSNIEDAPDFRDLTVSNQGPKTAALSGGNGLVGIVCTAHFVGKGAE